jgi:hypothetical protein
MFFDKFPKGLFRVSGQENYLVTDFLRGIRLDSKLKDESLHYTVYTAMDGETPEIISHKFYKTPQYHWILMLLNEKFDPFNDFPQLDSIVREQTIRQYGSLLGTHHYINSDGETVDQFTEPRFVVTNYEHMAQLNEKKRQVKILRPELLAEFVQIYDGAIARG